MKDSRRVTARARFVGTRIPLRAFEQGEPLAIHPLTIRVGERGTAVLFRFGAVVLVEVKPAEEAAFYQTIATLVESPFDKPEREELEIRVDAELREGVDAEGVLSLRSLGLERIQAVAHVLAKSTVLAHYEERITQIFDRIEALAEDLRRGARGPVRSGELLRQIGEVLLTQTRTVGRVEVTEKPEITWDAPELDRLYEHLAVEYELRERDLALARKFDLVSHAAETSLNLLQHRQNLRVEWYIVVLIAVEIALFVYDIAAR